MSRYCLALLVLLMGQVCSEKMESFSFAAPFESTDLAGVRVVGDSWKTSGTTEVLKNFIRLTPDRQSKKGALWTRKPLGVPAFSAQLQFRISGQGRTFFGDGVALWITQHAYNVEGIVHGFTERFVGVGVIFDTFRNTEKPNAHRDVTVLVNDGTKSYELMTEDVFGCAARIRYHSERADFSVTDSSRAKVVLQGPSLHVYVDAANTEDWVLCVSIDDVSLPEDWAKHAYIGVTATTGQLADNHDILGLQVYSDLASMEAAEAEYDLSDTDAHVPLDVQANRLGREVNGLLVGVRTLDHHLEHQLAAVQDSIQVLLAKLEAREAGSEGRIGQLEDIISFEVKGGLHERLGILEMKMRGKVDRRMSSMHSAMHKKMDRVEELSMMEQAEGWHLPFAILLLLLLAGAVGAYLFYEKMRKSHLL